MNPPPPTTLDRLLQQATAALAGADLHYGHGTDNPRDEAAWLVLHALGLPPDRPPADPAMVVAADAAAAAMALVGRRIRERLPAAYLTRRAWFGGVEYYVDERVLVPRSPLAEPIAARFSPWLDGVEVGAVLDLCTGSGCIALACARAFPEARIDASDLSPDALAVAAINVQRQGLGDRVRLLRSDLFASLPARRYQLIVSNPPYVGDAEMAQLPDEYRHEPDSALRAADDGLALVSRILLDALPYLDPQGLLVIEVGNTAELVEACYPDLDLHWLSFDSGGDGVFAVRAQDLRDWADGED